MSATNLKTTNQHYVPQFLLRHFAAPLKASQIAVFDKQEGSFFITNIRNVCAEAGFYDLQTGKGEFTMESSFTHLETKAGAVIKRVLTQERLPAVDSEDRAILAIFVAVQFLRVKAARIRVSDMNELLKLKLESIGAAQADIDRFTTLPEDEPKLISMGLLEKIEEFVPFFFFKTWLLMKTTNKAPLLISDNPVTLKNNKTFGVMGNLGLGVEGIEIYMPLSSNFSLGILCPSHEEQFTKIYERYDHLRHVHPEVRSKMGHRDTFSDEFMAGMKYGTSINMVPENALHLNSLQVAFSTRFLYGSRDLFDVAREMIRNNPAFKTAPRMELVT